MSASRLLFLDIDGVMHSVDRVEANATSIQIDTTGDRLFEHLPLLGQILDQCPDVSVIISSSWRDSYTLPELQGCFGDWGHRVIGSSGPPSVLMRWVPCRRTGFGNVRRWRTCSE